MFEEFDLLKSLLGFFFGLVRSPEVTFGFLAENVIAVFFLDDHDFNYYKKLELGCKYTAILFSGF